MKAFSYLATVALVGAFLFLAAGQPATSSLAAATSPSPMTGQQAACTAEEHRQFDFWLGEWTVTRTADGQLAGTSKISSAFAGCVLVEEYSSPSGYAGSSFNIYDAAQEVWHQTWVDNSGLLLELDGMLENGKMVLMGERPGPDDAMQLHQITWEAMDDGTVRQVWTTSDDQGVTWNAAFDGTYTKKAAVGQGG
ncbi:MAG: hypothetical protein V3U67_04580 [Gemmatimonadota bacterium]